MSSSTKAERSDAATKKPSEAAPQIATSGRQKGGGFGLKGGPAIPQGISRNNHNGRNSQQSGKNVNGISHNLQRGQDNQQHKQNQDEPAKGVVPAPVQVTLNGSTAPSNLPAKKMSFKEAAMANSKAVAKPATTLPPPHPVQVIAGPGASAAQNAPPFPSEDKVPFRAASAPPNLHEQQKTNERYAHVEPSLQGQQDKKAAKVKGDSQSQDPLHPPSQKGVQQTSVSGKNPPLVQLAPTASSSGPPASAWANTNTVSAVAPHVELPTPPANLMAKSAAGAGNVPGSSRAQGSLEGAASSSQIRAGPSTVAASQVPGSAPAVAVPALAPQPMDQSQNQSHWVGQPGHHQQSWARGVPAAGSLQPNSAPFHYQQPKDHHQQQQQHFQQQQHQQQQQQQQESSQFRFQQQHRQYQPPQAGGNRGGSEVNVRSAVLSHQAAQAIPYPQGHAAEVPAYGRPAAASSQSQSQQNLTPAGSQAQPWKAKKKVIRIVNPDTHKELDMEGIDSKKKQPSGSAVKAIAATDAVARASNQGVIGHGGAAPQGSNGAGSSAVTPAGKEGSVHEGSLPASSASVSETKKGTETAQDGFTAGHQAPSSQSSAYYHSQAGSTSLSRPHFPGSSVAPHPSGMHGRQGPGMGQGPPVRDQNGVPMLPVMPFHGRGPPHQQEQHHPSQHPQPPSGMTVAFSPPSFVSPLFYPNPAPVAAHLHSQRSNGPRGTQPPAGSGNVSLASPSQMPMAMTVPHSHSFAEMEAAGGMEPHSGPSPGVSFPGRGPPYHAFHPANQYHPHYYPAPPPHGLHQQQPQQQHQMHHQAHQHHPHPGMVRAPIAGGRPGQSLGKTGPTAGGTRNQGFGPSPVSQTRAPVASAAGDAGRGGGGGMGRDYAGPNSKQTGRGRYTAGQPVRSSSSLGKDSAAAAVQATAASASPSAVGLSAVTVAKSGSDGVSPEAFAVEADTTGGSSGIPVVYADNVVPTAALPLTEIVAVSVPSATSNKDVALVAAKVQAPVVEEEAIGVQVVETAVPLPGESTPVEAIAVNAGEETTVLVEQLEPKEGGSSLETVTKVEDVPDSQDVSTDGEVTAPLADAEIVSRQDVPGDDLGIVEEPLAESKVIEEITEAGVAVEEPASEEPITPHPTPLNTTPVPTPSASVKEGLDQLVKEIVEQSLLPGSKASEGEGQVGEVTDSAMVEAEEPESEEVLQVETAASVAAEESVVVASSAPDAISADEVTTEGCPPKSTADGMEETPALDVKPTAASAATPVAPAPAPVKRGKILREKLAKKNAAEPVSDIFDAYSTTSTAKHSLQPSLSASINAEGGSQEVQEEAVVEPAAVEAVVVAAEETAAVQQGPEDWEDADASVCVPKEAPAAKSADQGEGEDKKRYSRDFLLKFRDVRDETMSIPLAAPELLISGKAHTGQPSPSRGPGNSGRNLDRRGGSFRGGEEEWQGKGGAAGWPVQSPGSFRQPGPGSGGPGGRFGYGPGAGGNRQQAPFHGGPMGQPGQGSRGPAGRGGGGMDADRWQRNAPPPMMRPPAAVFHKSENRYEVGKVSEGEEAKQRIVKGILNKLTPQSFDKLFDKVLEVNIDSGETLSGVIGQIFDKALLEPTFCALYAQFCKRLAEAVPSFELPPSEDGSGQGQKLTFKRILLNKCQEEFEKGAMEEAKATREKDSESEELEPDVARLQASERAEKRQKARRRMLGNIRFIGELYIERMLTDKIMHHCIQTLLGNIENPEEEDVECLCKLMTTVGATVDHDKARSYVDDYFERMEKLAGNKNLPSRLRFALKDVSDLRRNGWHARRKVDGPKKIEEVHRDAARERSDAVAQASRQVMEQSQGGYRQQQSRDRMGMGRRNDSSDFRQQQQQQQGAGAGSRDRQGMGSRSGRGGQREESAVPLAVPPRSHESEVRFTPQSGFSRTGRGTGKPSVSILGNVPDARSVGPARPLPQPAPSAPGPSAGPPAWSARGHGEAVSDPPAPPVTAEKAGGKTEEQLDRASKQMLEEYISTQDLQEVRQCVQDLGDASYHPRMVLVWFNTAIEAKEKLQAPQALVRILLEVLKTGVLSKEHHFSGLEEILAGLLDVSMDAPKAPKHVGLILGTVVAEGHLSGAELGSMLAKKAEDLDECAQPAVEATLQTVAALKGGEVAAQTWADAGLPAEDFWESKEKADEFLAQLATS